MRSRTYLTVGAFFLATVFAFGWSAESASVSAQSDDPPKIFNARVKGKKLFVTGENFGPGSVILVGGQAQKTKNDSEFASTLLVAKKAGKRIPNNSTVEIQVRSNEMLSEKFQFFKGRIVTLDDVGKPLELKVGERFLLFLQKSGYEFSPTVLDPTILKKVETGDTEIIPGSQGLFEAIRVGSTKLNALGQLPCHKTEPACLAPALNIEFSVIVKE